MPNPDLAELIALVRSRGSVARVAEKAGLNRRTLEGWLQGRRPHPLALAEAVRRIEALTPLERPRTRSGLSTARTSSREPIVA